MNVEIIYQKVDNLIPYENNPRLNDSAVEAVASSIKEFVFKNPIVVDGNNTIINGHTRLKAAKELGIEKVPTIIAKDLTPDQVKAFRLADNKTGELAEWNDELMISELKEIVGVDMSKFGFDEQAEELEQELEDANPYTAKVKTPVYEPTGEKPLLSDLVDTSVRDRLVSKVKVADIPIDVRDFLIAAAQRHLKFNYKNIAEYYAQSNKEIQELMEDSALVIIDYNKAIQQGYVKISNTIQEMMEEDEEE